MCVLGPVNDPAGPSPGKNDDISPIDCIYDSAEDGQSDSQSVHDRGLVPSVHNDADASMSEDSENPVDPQSITDGMGQMYQLFYLLQKGLHALSNYHHDQALQIFTNLPGRQGETAWVLAKIGCLHMQRVEYQTAFKYFMKARTADPTHMEDMDFFSSMLFLMEDATNLSHLASELRALDRCVQSGALL